MKNFLGMSLLITLAPLTTAHADQTHYDVLKDKYDNHSNGTLTREQLEGTYLGRCFQPTTPDQADGMLMTTKKFVTTTTQNQDEGPDFPEVSTTNTSWKMAFIQTTNGDYESNDSVESDSIDAYWDHPTVTAGNSQQFDFVTTELTLNRSVATSDATSPALVDAVNANDPTKQISSYAVEEQVKMGDDGSFYGQKVETVVAKGVSVTNTEFCYFWKKLF